MIKRIYIVSPLAQTGQAARTRLIRRSLRTTSKSGFQAPGQIGLPVADDHDQADLHRIAAGADGSSGPDKADQTISPNNLKKRISGTGANWPARRGRS